jgi:dimethylargininase
MQRRVLIRRPGPLLANGIVTYRERRPVDLDLARSQWMGYVDALVTAGFEPIELTPVDDCPDGVFVEDTLVVRAGLAVVTRPGAEARRAETASAGAAARSLGLRVERIDAPATLDGGDVLDVGETVYVGVGGRTSRDGARELGELLGVRLVEVPVERVLHLKSAVTALPDGTVVGFVPLTPGRALFPRFLPVPEESGAQVVVLGERAVLVAADCPRSAELFASLGLDVRVVDIGELQKLEGCVTCLSVLV